MAPGDPVTPVERLIYLQLISRGVEKDALALNPELPEKARYCLGGEISTEGVMVWRLMTQATFRRNVVRSRDGVLFENFLVYYSRVPLISPLLTLIISQIG